MGKKIITDIEQLSKRCDEINQLANNKEIRDTASALKVAMRENGICAMAAPCIGIENRIICVAIDGMNKIQTYVNPIIAEASGVTLSRETCECLPGQTYIIPRNTKIKIMYQTPMGKVETKVLKGVAAIILQHQIQHLDGILLSDFGLPLDDSFDEMSLEDQEQLLREYMDSLDIYEDELNADIKGDEDSKQLHDAIDFITKVNAGEVELVKIDGEK